MAGCAAKGIAHRGGLAHHGRQRLYARQDGAVVRLGHPDDVRRLAGSGDAEVAVLVVDATEPAPDPGHFDAPQPGQRPSATSYDQARSSHDFPVPPAASASLKKLVAGAGAACGEQPASMEQVEAETARWVALAGQVGMMDLQTTVRSFSPAGGPPVHGAAWLRTLAERRLQAEGRLSGPSRLVAAPAAKVPQDRLAGELKAIRPVAGARPSKKVRMLPPSRPAGGDAVSHFELRFAERVSGIVGDREQIDAAAGDGISELADSIERTAADIDPDAIAKALPLVEQLLTNPLHDARFAYDATETSRRELAKLQTNGDSYRRTTLVVDDPSGDPTRKLGIIVSVEPAPRGASAEDRQAAWVRPVSCYRLESTPAGTDGVSMPIRDELRLGGYAGSDMKPAYGDDQRVEQRLQKALLEVSRRRRLR